MLRTLSTIGIALALAGGVEAQSSLTPRRKTAPTRSRGTYHLATGTWTRADPAASFNAEVLFNNTHPWAYYLATSGDFDTVDHGRLPSPTSPDNQVSVSGTDESYTITCFQIAYCSEIPATNGGVDFELDFYENYGPCTDLQAPSASHSLVAGFVATGLVGGTPSSGLGCWVASFDLANTTATFTLNGDADGTWDDQPNADSFGWALRFPGAIQGDDGNGTGPFIAGACPSGGVQGNPTSYHDPQQGYQTKFAGDPGATDATGLGTSDFFWIDAAGLVPNANGGCFFFGAMGNGCTDPAIMLPSANPYGSFYLQLFGYDVDPNRDRIGTRYCGKTINGTGDAAVLSVAGTDPHADLVFTSAPVPNTIGQFFYGPMMLNLAGSLGSGFRCVGGMTSRMLPFVTAGMMMNPANTATFTVNYTAPYASGLTGTRYFQHWFRDPSAFSGSNASDGIGITF